MGRKETLFRKVIQLENSLNNKISELKLLTHQINFETSNLEICLKQDVFNVKQLLLEDTGDDNTSNVDNVEIEINMREGAAESSNAGQLAKISEIERQNNIHDISRLKQVILSCLEKPSETCATTTPEEPNSNTKAVIHKTADIFNNFRLHEIYDMKPLLMSISSTDISDAVELDENISGAPCDEENMNSLSEEAPINIHRDSVSTPENVEKPPDKLKDTNKHKRKVRRKQISKSRSTKQVSGAPYSSIIDSKTNVNKEGMKNFDEININSTRAVF